MTPDNAQAVNEELQFDRVVSDAPPADQPSQRPIVSCAGCSTPIQTEYYHVNGRTTCERCRDAVAAQLTVPRGWGPFTRAAALGIGAAIAGAIVYYAVIAITDFEIGIVAILIGYMVGYAVRKGTGGRGGRRFQVLAAVLTYWAVGLAYTPIAFKGASDGDAEKPAAVAADSARDSASPSVAASITDSATAPNTAPATNPTTAPAPAVTRASSGDSAASPAVGGEEEKAGGGPMLLGLGALFVFVFALPVMIIAGSLPSGLISAFIIFIGIHQAWRMTAAPPLKVSGPYRVGAQPSVAAG